MHKFASIVHMKTTRQNANPRYPRQERTLVTRRVGAGRDQGDLMDTEGIISCTSADAILFADSPHRLGCDAGASRK